MSTGKLFKILKSVLLRKKAQLYWIVHVAMPTYRLKPYN